MSVSFVRACSRFRDVPDNQEVWADVATDRSVIIELLELAEDVPDEAIASHVFETLAESNDAGAAGLHAPAAVSVLDTAIACPALCASLARAGAPPCYAAIMQGTQHVSKFKEEERNVVGVWLAVLRLRGVGTDLVLSLNAPLALAPHSSSRAAVSEGVVTAEGLVQPVVIADSTAVMNAMLASIEVLDWSLFSPQ